MTKSIPTFKTYCEELQDQGTYIAAVPTPESAEALNQWLRNGLIAEDVQSALDFHMTIVYSKVTLPIDRPSIPAFFSASASQLSNFNNNLVLELSSPVAVRLNRVFHLWGAVEDFPEYHPHVTLITHLSEWESAGGNWSQLDAQSAPPLEFYQLIAEPLNP